MRHMEYDEHNARSGSDTLAIVETSGKQQL